MLATKDQAQTPAAAHAPRPLRPRLAAAQSPSPRRSPVPRVAGQGATNITPTPVSIPSRRPLSSIASPPVARPSPSSGRSTPFRPPVASNTSPRSPLRFPKADSGRSSPTGIVVRNTGFVQSPLGQPATRPRVVRGLTAASAPPMSQGPTAPKQDGKNAGGFATRPTPSFAAGGRISPAIAKAQRPALVKSTSFFHADEIPVRSPSPEFAPLKNVPNFIHARGVQQERSTASPLDKRFAQAKTGAQKVPPREEEQARAVTQVNPHLTNPINQPAATPLEAPQVNPSPFQNPDSITLDAVGPSKDDYSASRMPDASEADLGQTVISSLSSAPTIASTARRPSGLGSTASPPLYRQTRSVSFTTTNLQSRDQSARANSSLSSLPTVQPSKSTSQPLDSALPTTQPDDISNPDSSIPAAQAQENQNPISARHERKLLDLEISNSSLLALNRSLEREVAKQKAELRRLRRATRDRGMWASDASNADEGSSEIGSRLSGVNETDDVTGETLDGGDDSPSRKRSRRLRESSSAYLDLAKHKQVLADSQRINTALQRCLSITDTLIRDGDKALEYSVHAHDLQNSHDTIAECDGSGHLLNDDEADAEASEHERERWRTVQEEMYARQAEVEALVRAWQGLGTSAGAGRGAVTYAGVSAATVPVREAPRSRKETEKDADLEDRDSGVDLDYSARSSDMGTAVGSGQAATPATSALTPAQLAEIEAEMF